MDRITAAVRASLAADASATLGVPVDVRRVNDAPVSFLFHVLRGRALVVRDEIMLAKILKNLDAMDTQVMLKLSLPVVPGTFDALTSHPKVLRVVALSGGYKRPEACVELSKNKGIIASFSRALLEDLRFLMSDAEFDAALGGAIDDIFKGSTQKVAA